MNTVIWQFFLIKALGECLLCGLSSVATQRKFLAEDKLNLKKTTQPSVIRYLQNWADLNGLASMDPGAYAATSKAL